MAIYKNLGGVPPTHPSLPPKVEPVGESTPQFSSIDDAMKHLEEEMKVTQDQTQQDIKDEYRFDDTDHFTPDGGTSPKSWCMKCVLPIPMNVPFAWFMI